MTIYPCARLPDKWVEQARLEGAHVDYTLKSDWQTLCAFDGSTAGGFIGLLLVSNTKAHIRGWYVFPEHRGKGVGGRLLEHAADWARLNGYHHLDIRTSHNVAWAGFIPTGYVREHGNQEAQYIMDIVA